MERIKLRICMGTMCYVMGGAQLKNSLDLLPSELRDNFDISYATCLGYCNQNQDPPYIELNGRMVSRASQINLNQLLKEEIKNVIR